MYLNKIKFFENIIFVILISLLLTNFAKADLIKPNSGIEPIQVVKIQLRGLKNNDQHHLLQIFRDQQHRLK